MRSNIIYVADPRPGEVAAKVRLAIDALGTSRERKHHGKLVDDHGTIADKSEWVARVATLLRQRVDQLLAEGRAIPDLIAGLDAYFAAYPEGASVLLLLERARLVEAAG